MRKLEDIILVGMKSVGTTRSQKLQKYMTYILRLVGLCLTTLMRGIIFIGLMQILGLYIHCSVMEISPSAEAV